MTVLFHDTFNRADNPTSLGNGWVVDAAGGVVYGIQSKQAVLETPGFSFPGNDVLQNPGVSDCYAQLKANVPILATELPTGKNGVLVFRAGAIGSNNFVTLYAQSNDTLKCSEINGGSFSGFDATSPVIPGISKSQNLGVFLQGGTLKVYSYGTLVWTVLNIGSVFLNTPLTNKGFGFSVDNLGTMAALDFLITDSAPLPGLGPGRAIFANEVNPQNPNGRQRIRVYRGSLIVQEKLDFVAFWNGDVTSKCAPFGDQWYLALPDTDGLLKIDISQPGQFQDGI